MKKVKKSNDKGFTLVELIVVIVILAILAAILVPALLGYIDKAKNQQVVLNAKSCLTAAQAEFSSLYAAGKTSDKISDSATSILTTADVASVCDALDVGITTPASTASSTDHAYYTITYVKYIETGKNAIYFDGTTWTDTDPGTSGKTVYTIKAASNNTDTQ